jgi:uracil-DNA glycosylase family 4
MTITTKTEVETEFERYDKGVEQYKDVRVIQGPVCHDDCVRSYGASGSKVMFVGIAPARDEIERSKRPLTGPSGKLLDACLEAINLKRNETYCTNLICTWIDDSSKVPQDKIDICYMRLLDEIKIIRPKFIVLLGTLVTEFITGRKFNKVRGAVQWNKDVGCYVMGTYHPSAILRSMGDYGASKDDKASTMIYDFIRDLKKLPDVIEWGSEAPEAQVRYRVVNSIEQAQNVLDNLPRNEDFPITLDVETTYGKDDEEVEVFKDDVLCVGVGSDNFCWVFTPDALYKKDGTPALVWPADIWWTMHNSIFDSQVVRRKLGYWLDIKEDTMLQSYSLDERSGVHKLKTLAREYLGAGFYEDDRFYGKLKLEDIPRSMLYEYNAKDVVYTTRLCYKLRKWQVEDNVRNFYLNILIPAVNMYKEAQYHGVNIDNNMLTYFTWDWGVKIIEAESDIQELVENEGWEGDLNLQSHKQLTEFIFRTLSLPIVKYTRKGEPSVDKEVLEQLREQHEFIPKLERVRRLYKMWGTYIVNLPETLKVDGRAHPIVKLHGTATGRPSYTELAVQTFVAPSHPSEFNRLRELIIPPPFTGYEGTDDYVCPEDDEYVIVEVDYGKAELWMAYSYSRDPQMLQDLLSGDYHTNVAMDIYEKQREEVTGDDRTWAKRTSFGILYDIEENTLAKLTRSDAITSRGRISRWFERNKAYYKWFKDTQKQILKTGELVSKTGRKRRIIVLGNAHRAVKQAVNYPIQSTSSDVVLKAATKIHPRLKKIGSHLLFTVHDSIVTKALKSRLIEHCQIMHEEMTRVHFEGVVPIPVEIKVGTSWGTVKGIHDCAEASTHKLNVGNNMYNINMGGHCLYEYYTNVLGVCL